MKESSENVVATLGVHHFGVHLHRIEATGRVFHHRDGSQRGTRRDDESLRGTRDGVAVAHPHRALLGPLREQGRFALTRQGGAAVLTTTGRGHFPTELLGHELRAVANAEHRNAKLVDAGVKCGSRRLVDRLRSTRQDDRRGLTRRDVGRRDGRRDNLRIYVCFSHTPGNQLRVLRAKVNNENGG